MHFICMHACAGKWIHVCAFTRVCAWGWEGHVCRHTDTRLPVCSPTETSALGSKVCCVWLLPQAHNCTRKDFEKMYPAFSKFCAIREKLDPTGMFLNAYLEKVFY